MTIKRVKVAGQYYQLGYGRGMKKANVYLIDGFLYAKDMSNWRCELDPLEGDLVGYVRINEVKAEGYKTIYCQCYLGDHARFASEVRTLNASVPVTHSHATGISDGRPIQRIIEIPLQEVRSPEYEKNLQKYGDNQDTCICCGRKVKSFPECKMVHLLTNGNIVSYPDEDIEGSQGFFPVGNDCAKRLVISFAF
jgi:hypothetical protein